jgi:hypothetical protein
MLVAIIAFFLCIFCSNTHASFPQYTCKYDGDGFLAEHNSTNGHYMFENGFDAPVSFQDSCPHADFTRKHMCTNCTSAGAAEISSNRNESYITINTVFVHPNMTYTLGIDKIYKSFLL